MKTINDVLRSTVDHEWNATMHCLAFPSIAGRTLRHVHPDERTIDWAAIANEHGFSTGERILIDAALGFWTGGNHSLWSGDDCERLPTQATVANIACTLSGHTMSWLLEGLRIRTGRR